MTKNKAELAHEVQDQREAQEELRQLLPKGTAISAMWIKATTHTTDGTPRYHYSLLIAHEGKPYVLDYLLARAGIVTLRLETNKECAHIADRTAFDMVHAHIGITLWRDDRAYPQIQTTINK